MLVEVYQLVHYGTDDVLYESTDRSDVARREFSSYINTDTQVKTVVKRYYAPESMVERARAEMLADKQAEFEEYDMYPSDEFILDHWSTGDIEF